MEKLMFRLFGHKPKKHTEYPKTTFKTCLPEEQLSYNKWCETMNISSRYGLKGSFYNN